MLDTIYKLDLCIFLFNPSCLLKYSTQTNMITSSLKIYLNCPYKSHTYHIYIHTYMYIMYIHVICHILTEYFIEYARFIMLPVAPTACQLYLYPQLHRVEEGKGQAAVQQAGIVSHC